MLATRCGKVVACKSLQEARWTSMHAGGGHAPSLRRATACLGTVRSPAGMALDLATWKADLDKKETRLDQDATRLDQKELDIRLQPPEQQERLYNMLYEDKKALTADKEALAARWKAWQGEACNRGQERMAWRAGWGARTSLSAPGRV